MADMADIERKQADTAKTAQKLVQEKDPKRILELAEEVQKKTGELLKMALSFQAAMAPQETTGPETQVKLTPEQKERVTQQTGVGIEVVTLHDSKKRSWTK